MKIARLLHEKNETYGFVKGDKIATKDEITFLTGVPIPLSVKIFFLMDGMRKLKTKLKIYHMKKISQNINY